MNKQIMFFDDYPLEGENQLFTALLRRRLRGRKIDVIEEKIVPRVETNLRVRAFIAVVLDVIAMPGDNVSGEVQLPPEDEYTSETWTGIEILRRCRAGEYGSLNRDAPIFLRTARGEIHVRSAALKHGCTDYFLAGIEDNKLIDALVRVVDVLP